jgi:tetratricopeptide (TPR) repeat protein
MKRLLTAIWLLLLCCALTGLAQTSTRLNTAKLSPAEQSIERSKQAIEKNPRQADPYNELAFAFARRARETSDVTYYTQAEEAVKKSLALAPGNPGGEKARVWVLLGKHEFAQALEAAKVLNKRVPDDLLVYAYLTDANAELGNYDEAEKAANWMLKLRPGNIAGLTRAAYLREIFGDTAGSLELMEMAYQSTPPAELEERAWILTQMAHLKLFTGETGEAEKLLQEALALFPGYHYALGNLAKLRIEQKEYEQAVGLLKQRYEAAPHAENLYELAEALALAGRVEEARNCYTEFEKKALAESAQWDNANRELIFYYANYANKPAESLRIAQLELARRRDLYTLDAHAWALYKSGQRAEARRQMEAVLAIGAHDPKILARAELIKR